MRVIIIGCGRVGARVAAELDSRGENVTVIDTSARAFGRLPTTFKGETVRGSGTDEAQKARASAACLGSLRRQAVTNWILAMAAPKKDEAASPPASPPPVLILRRAKGPSRRMGNRRDAPPRLSYRNLISCTRISLLLVTSGRKSIRGLTRKNPTR